MTENFSVIFKGYGHLVISVIFPKFLGFAKIKTSQKPKRK